MSTQTAKRFKFPSRIQISDDHKAFKQINIEWEQLLAECRVAQNDAPCFPRANKQARAENKSLEHC